MRNVRVSILQTLIHRLDPQRFRSDHLLTVISLFTQLAIVRLEIGADKVNTQPHAGQDHFNHLKIRHLAAFDFVFPAILTIFLYIIKQENVSADTLALYCTTSNLRALLTFNSMALTNYREIELIISELTFSK